MLYASSKDAIRKKLVGVGVEVQATDPSEISFDAVLEKIKSIWANKQVLSLNQAT